MPAGRPSAFTPELATAILEALPYEDGGLEAICQNPDFPSDRTVYRWLADPKHADFRQAYAHAREVGGHVQADRAVSGALAATDASLGRLVYDARKWKASKLNTKYGDKLAVTGGGEGDAPLEVVTTTPRERAKALAVLLAKQRIPQS